MKTILLTLLALSVSASNFFKDPAKLGSLNKAPSGGAACATANTVLPHDEMLFGWESGD